MPKRDTVKPNVDAILKMVASNSWSAASFSKMVGKHKRWLSEVKRGNNLPSPEEAARMCVLLQTTPEEILAEQADIDQVNALLENEMAKEKAPAHRGRGLYRFAEGRYSVCVVITAGKAGAVYKNGSRCF